MEKEEVSEGVKRMRIPPDMFVEGESFVREVAGGIAAEESVDEEEISGGEIVIQEQAGGENVRVDLLGG